MLCGLMGFEAKVLLLDDKTSIAVVSKMAVITW